MRKKIKQVVSLCLVLLVGLTCLPFTAGAADAPVIAIGSAAGNPGERVTVDVTIANNPGIVALRIFVQADHQALKLTKVENGSLFADNTSTFGNDLDADVYTMLWADSTARTNMAQDGVLATLTFEVQDEADGMCPILLSYDSQSTFNKDMTNVTFTTQNGSIEAGVTTYTAAFMVDGAEYSSAQYKEGDAIVKPTDPQKDGYIFKGWTPEIPAAMPAKDMTFTAVFEQAPVAVSLRITKMPTKTTYTYRKDTSINLSGLELEMTYSDGTTKSVDPSDCTVTGYSAKPRGEKTITVAAEGREAQFTVNVKYVWWQYLILIFLLGFIWY